MKKITKIEVVEFIDVQGYLNDGWSLYGYPLVSTGLYAGGYQCMVKYSDEEVGEKVVDYTTINSSFCGNQGSPVSVMAEGWMKIGFQPYGPILERRDQEEDGRVWVRQTLAMVRYE